MILLTVIAIVLTSTTFGALSVRQDLSSQGTVSVSAGLGVYSDSACQNAISTINWGSISPGQTITRTVYIKNTGSGVSLSLSMNTSNWSPASANGPIMISWNQAGTRLAPNQSVAATLTLTASSGITDITNFNVQISIVGTE